MPPATRPRPRTPITLIVATTPIPIPLRTPGSPAPGTPATTTKLGIGKNGTLPWPRIKADMTFFARVTSRVPDRTITASSSSSTAATAASAPSAGTEAAGAEAGAASASTTAPTTTTTTTTPTTNAIIMGRKTYHSIPGHLRPLRRRISVVVSRDSGAGGGSGGSVRRSVLEDLEAREEDNRVKGALGQQQQQQIQAGTETQGRIQPKPEPKPEPVTDAVVCPSLEGSLEYLDRVYGNGDSYDDDDGSNPNPTEKGEGDGTTALTPQTQNQKQKQKQKRTSLGKIFIIGGSEIYCSALQLPRNPSKPRPLRIIMTVIQKKETNTNATANTSSNKENENRPDNGNGDGNPPATAVFDCDTFFPLDAHQLSPEFGWREVPMDELCEWVGERVEAGWRDEGGVWMRILGYERV